MVLSTFTLYNHHQCLPPEFSHLPKSKLQRKSFKQGCDVERSWNPPSPCPPRSQMPPLTLPTPRLQKILAESPPPARLDIQLPIISDDFKFQVWRKMFRALMPGTGRDWLRFVCDWAVDGRPYPPWRGLPVPTGEATEGSTQCPFASGVPPCSPLTCVGRRAFESMGFAVGD